MKITCQREKLLSAFSTVTPVVPSRSPKEILKNIKLDVTKQGGTLMATDLEVGVRVEVDGLTVDQPGLALLSPPRIGSILRESSDEALKIETDDKGITVRGDRSEFRLQAHDPHEYPAIAAFGEAKFHQLPARLLRETIRRTVFATDPESSRYALGGVLFEFAPKQITAVGTDGRRMAVVEVAAESVGGHESSDIPTIIPARALQVIERALGDAEGDCQVAARGSDVLVKSDRATIYSRLVEGRFPRWRDVFPHREGAQKVELNVGPFLSTVRQAAIVTGDESRGVDFTFADGLLTLAARGKDVGQSRVELPIAYGGDKVTITLDPRYVVDFLRVVDLDKTVTVEFSDSDGPAVFSAEGGYRYVIMPLSRE